MRTSLNHASKNPILFQINRASKLAYYRQLALDVFVAGLQELLGSMVRTKAPTPLSEAIQFITKEKNIMFSKSTPK